MKHCVYVYQQGQPLNFSFVVLYVHSKNGISCNRNYLWFIQFPCISPYHTFCPLSTIFPFHSSLFMEWFPLSAYQTLILIFHECGGWVSLLLKIIQLTLLRGDILFYFFVELKTFFSTFALRLWNYLCNRKRVQC